MGSSLGILLFVLFSTAAIAQEELSSRKLILKEHLDQRQERIQRAEDCLLEAASMDGIDRCLRELELDLTLMDDELGGQELQWERQEVETQSAEEALRR